MTLANRKRNPLTERLLSLQPGESIIVDRSGMTRKQVEGPIDRLKKNHGLYIKTAPLPGGKSKLTRVPE